MLNAFCGFGLTPRFLSCLWSLRLSSKWIEMRGRENPNQRRKYLVVGNGKEGVEGGPQCICNEIVKDRDRR